MECAGTLGMSHSPMEVAFLYIGACIELYTEDSHALYKVYFHRRQLTRLV